MHKLYLIIISLMIAVCSVGQNTGTLKLTKDLPQKKKRWFYASAFSTLAGKSSPELVRDYEMQFGTYITPRKDFHANIVTGLTTGRSYPTENHSGLAMGAFMQWYYYVYMGARWNFQPKFQLSYRRAFNSNSEFDNWNQYNAAIGFSIDIGNTAIKGLQVTFLGHYRYDKLPENSKKGIFPSIGLDYRF